MEIKAFYKCLIEDLSMVTDSHLYVDIDYFNEILECENIINECNERFSYVFKALSSDPPESFGPFLVKPQTLPIELFDKVLQVLGVFKKIEPCAGLELDSSTKRQERAREKFFKNAERMRNFDYKNSPFPKGLEERIFETLSPMAVICRSLSNGAFPSGNTKETGTDMLEKIKLLETVSQFAISNIISRMYEAYDNAVCANVEYCKLNTSVKNRGEVVKVNASRKKEISGLTQSVWAAIHGKSLCSLSEKEVASTRRTQKSGRGYRRLLQKFISTTNSINIREQELTDRLSYVPKSPEIDRIIFVQSAKKLMLSFLLLEGWSSILKEVGIMFPSGRKKFDFSNQGESRRLGRSRYSFTIDSKSASDSYSWEMMRNKMPNFLKYFESFSSKSIEVDGKVLSSPMFTGMGSIFCFPMQTVVFYAICEEVCREHGIKDIPKRLRTYGDDIVFQSNEPVDELYSAIVKRMEATGFVINEEKSFSSNSIMSEVCGAMFYKKCDVRPVYLRRTDFSPSIKKKTGRQGEIPSIVTFYNGMCMKGMYKTASYLKNELYRYEKNWHFGCLGYGITTVLEPTDYIAVKDRENSRIPFLHYGLLQPTERTSFLPINFHICGKLGDTEIGQFCSKLYMALQKYEDTVKRQVQLHGKVLNTKDIDKRIQDILYMYREDLQVVSRREVFSLVSWRKYTKTCSGDKTKISLTKRLMSFTRNTKQVCFLGTLKNSELRRTEVSKRQQTVENVQGLNISEDRLTEFLNSDKPLNRIIDLDIRTTSARE